MLKTIELFNKSQESIEEAADRILGTNHTITKELISACNRCNYNQRNYEVNALAGAISLVPLIDGRLF